MFMLKVKKDLLNTILQELVLNFESKGLKAGSLKENQAGYRRKQDIIVCRWNEYFNK